MLGLVEADERCGYRLKAGIDAELAHPRRWRVTTGPRGVRGSAQGDILAIGCSQTFGWGVQEPSAWPAQLSRLIGKSVVNAGCPGWGTTSIAQELETVGRNYSLVIIGHYGDHIERSINRCFPGSRDWCLEVPHVRNMQIEPPDVDWNRDIIDGKRPLFGRAPHRKTPTKGGEESVGRFLYERIASFCKALVVWIPDYRLNMRGAPEWLPDGAVDCTEALQERLREIEIPDDGHLNELGHSIVAAAVADAVSRGT